MLKSAGFWFVDEEGSKGPDGLGALPSGPPPNGRQREAGEINYRETRRPARRKRATAASAATAAAAREDPDEGRARGLPAV